MDPVIFRELIAIHKIIEDETWLEGERRGCWVSFEDPVVRENVCRVVLRVGQRIREAAVAEILANGAKPAGSSGTNEGQGHRAA